MEHAYNLHSVRFVVLRLDLSRAKLRAIVDPAQFTFIATQQLLKHVRKKA